MVAVLIVVIIAGMFLIRRLNAQRAEKIGAFHYSDALPGVGRRNRKSPGAAASGGPTGDGTLREDREGTMTSPELPPAGHAQVSIIAATPEAARHVAEVLRRCFDATEQRSYPAGADGGTRLHLTVDTTHMAEPARSWLLTSRPSSGDHP